MNKYDQQTGPSGDRRQSHRSIAGERMYRQRIYMLAEVWDQLDALMQTHGDLTVNQLLTRLVRDEHRRMKASNDSTSQP